MLAPRHWSAYRSWQIILRAVEQRNQRTDKHNSRTKQRKLILGASTVRILLLRDTVARQGETLNPSLDAQVNLVRALAKPEKKPEVVAKELARHCIDIAVFQLSKDGVLLATGTPSGVTLSCLLYTSDAADDC